MSSGSRDISVQTGSTAKLNQERFLHFGRNNERPRINLGFAPALISVPADGLFRLVQSDIERVLFDGPAIHKRIDEIAAQITTDYSDRELVVIAF